MQATMCPERCMSFFNSLLASLLGLAKKEEKSLASLAFLDLYKLH
jgi:hypothetical protein